MAPGSRCMSGNTCGCGMSWTYRWTIMVPLIITRGGRVLYALVPHTITPAVGVVSLKSKDRIEVFTTGSPDVTAISIAPEIESGFLA
ncbi:hypothetical protein TNCV_4849211 [Trichonephila clavipes]|nr:hypothetical protein TNCV_4849211 [Trichonephila clavipes]